MEQKVRNCVEDEDKIRAEGGKFFHFRLVRSGLGI